MHGFPAGRAPRAAEPLATRLASARGSENRRWQADLPRRAATRTYVRGRLSDRARTLRTYVPRSQDIGPVATRPPGAPARARSRAAGGLRRERGRASERPRAGRRGGMGGALRRTQRALADRDGRTGGPHVRPSPARPPGAAPPGAGCPAAGVCAGGRASVRPLALHDLPLKRAVGGPPGHRTAVPPRGRARTRPARRRSGTPRRGRVIARARLPAHARSRRARQSGPPGDGEPLCEQKPAASYSPRPLRAKYHRR